MALHRDIFWVGRQWAVTGFGIQAVDQKHKGHFDIEVGRLWEDDLTERLQADGWLNKEDFGKALFVARSRYPEPTQAPPPAPPPATTAKPLRGETVGLSASAPIVPLMEPPRPVEPPSPGFELRIVGWPAKFVRPWHVRVRR